MPKFSEQFITIFDYIEEIKLNQKYPFVQHCIARRKADKFSLKDETFSEVLDRMENETEEYLDWDEILDYFTRRGRPKYAQK